MKLLLFSDLHCNAQAAACLVDHSASVDVLVGAGDFATVRRDLPTTLNVLRHAQKPTVLVPGNAESFEELRDACADWPAARVLHGMSAEIDGVTFYGVGGGIPVTPFGAWSFDFTEEQATALLADCPRGCVLVTHSPPKGAVDVSSLGRSLGSTAIRATIEAQQPQLAVCGHIHESAGREEWIGRTPVINAGAAWRRVDVARAIVGVLLQLSASPSKGNVRSLCRRIFTACCTGILADTRKLRPIARLTRAPRG